MQETTDNNLEHKNNQIDIKTTKNIQNPCFILAGNTQNSMSDSLLYVTPKTFFKSALACNYEMMTYNKPDRTVTFETAYLKPLKQVKCQLCVIRLRATVVKYMIRKTNFCNGISE